ncbi:MAG: DUF4062 domain-containing protein [Chlorobiaceae bacterium]|nr:DUF4062 domain-containing protein [Chlorobiaceae bacterium]
MVAEGCQEMGNKNQQVRVFLASPGDVEEERLAFRELLSELSTRTDYEFIPLGWEDVLASTGNRPQDLINALLDQCDAFICVYHKRWGAASTDTVGYTAYTQEEFQRALRRHTKTGSPRIFCFFKQVEISALADPGEQLTKVLNFRHSLETSAQVMYRVFSSVNDFQSQVEQHLLAMVRGELPEPKKMVRKIHIPIVSDQEPEFNISRELELAKQAASAAANGNTDEAAILFARLSQTSRNIQILDAARAFFIADGNLDAAQSLLERKLTLIHDRRLAAREYLSVFMASGWLDDLVEGTSNIEAAEALRRIFAGDRFKEVMVQSMAEYFTVGELLALARFYSGEGGTITAKFGRFMVGMPTLLSQLFNDDSL